MANEGAEEIRGGSTAQTLATTKATGELTLFYNWLESYSGHQAVTTHIKLVPGSNGTVILDQSDEDIGCIPGMLSHYSKNKYEIDMDSLISFIKNNGKKIE